MLNIFSRFLNSFSGFKGLKFTNGSSDKGFVTPPMTPTKEQNKQLFSKNISFDEYQALSTLLFHWADSYDSKDWMRLSKILAPVLTIDYTLVNGKSFPDMPAASFLAMISSAGFLGDPLLKTQHLLGACEYERISEDEIIAKQQLRAGHLRFEDESHKVEKKRGHSHATNEFYFKRVWIQENGQPGRMEWRWAGLKPEVRWNEYEFETIFSGFEAPRV